MKQKPVRTASSPSIGRLPRPGQPDFSLRLTGAALLPPALRLSGKAWRPYAGAVPNPKPGPFSGSDRRLKGLTGLCQSPRIEGYPASLSSSI
jgi:hypothetical protein